MPRGLKIDDMEFFAMATWIDLTSVQPFYTGAVSAG